MQELMVQIHETALKKGGRNGRKVNILEERTDKLQCIYVEGICICSVHSVSFSWKANKVEIKEIRNKKKEKKK